VTQGSGREITLLLKQWAGGKDSALDELVPIVYDDLRRMAHRQMTGERSGHTLQSDALINEAFLRLIKAKQVDWSNRAHFFAYFATMMRRILVDHARTHCRQKRSGARKEVSLNTSTMPKSDADARISSLDDALCSLEKMDPRKAKIVEMRYFGGFSVEETAQALGISVRTVMNDMKFSKVWLIREMKSRSRNNESGTNATD
jgi:RNA polymerase sigma-70 factor (ECF subfamily)